MKYFLALVVVVGLVGCHMDNHQFNSLDFYNKSLNDTAYTETTALPYEQGKEPNVIIENKANFFYDLKISDRKMNEANSYQGISTYIRFQLDDTTYIINAKSDDNALPKIFWDYVRRKHVDIKGNFKLSMYIWSTECDRIVWATKPFPPSIKAVKS